jgi:GMP reductase
MKFELIEIEKIDSYEAKDETVYDLTVEEDHSYCVSNSIIVHNSGCSTRMVTHVGFPQLSAIIECADAAHGVGGHICSDGGIRRPGHVAAAIGGGADFVMIGGYFAGHDQCGGKFRLDETGKKTSMVFYGMSSTTAMEKHYGNKAKYRASEGRTMEVPYKGDVEQAAEEILGGLRSTCTYVGTNKLKDLSKCTTFIRVNRIHDNPAL